jgi:hypothetical protein
VPWNLDPITPTEALGPSLHLIDPIRKECQVYIILKQRPNDKSFMFCVFGKSLRGVRRACQRLINYQKMIQLTTLPPGFEFYLVKPVKFTEAKKEIVQLEYQAPRLLGDHGDTVPAEATGLALFGFGDEPMKDWSEWDQPKPTEILEKYPGEIAIVDYSNELNAKYVEMWFTHVMADMPSYTGSLEMRARIGTCTFHSFPGKDYGNFHVYFFRQFLTDRNADMNQLSSAFAHELGHVDVERQLLERFTSEHSKMRFIVRDFETFGEPKPEYVVSFILVDTNSINAKDKYRLQIHFPTPTSRGDVKWFHIPKAEHNVLNVNILDFKHVNYSYNLLIKKTLALSEGELMKLPKEFTHFAQTVTLGKEFVDSHFNDTSYQGRMFETNPRHSHRVKIESAEQRRTWSFQFDDTDYIVDLHLFQTDDNKTRKKSEGRWGVEVHHKTWDEQLRQNEHLSVGESAKWKPREHDFFPLSSNEWQQTS